MKYYIFKVKDTLGQEYYILNNQYIGYVGIVSNAVLAILEQARNVEQKYQRYAESGYISDGDAHDRKLHELNCTGTRFTHKEVLTLMKDHPVFTRSRDKAWYEVHFPDHNSSVSYLKEIGGHKTIK